MASSARSFFYSETEFLALAGNQGIDIDTVHAGSMCTCQMEAAQIMLGGAGPSAWMDHPHLFLWSKAWNSPSTFRIASTLLSILA